MNFEEDNPKQRSSIMSALRRAWSRSPKRKIILEDARHPVDKGPRGGTRFVCACCGKSFGSNDLSVDHLDPVVPIGTPAKDMSWDAVVNRMFNSPKENLQAICKECHAEKSKLENEERRRARNARQNT